MDQYPILVKPTPSSPVSNPPLILQTINTNNINDSSQSDTLQVKSPILVKQTD